MLRVGSYVFKRAETSQEFEQIHRLNHQTFVREIPQHPDDGSELLVDKFHHKNAYFIVLKGERVVGMLSAHDQPPFSVATRLSEPEILSQPDTRPLEVRLLAIEPAERNSTMFFGLIWSLYEFARSKEYTHLVISGVTDRQDLYERLGFIAMGPAVASGDAFFVPMMLKIGQLPVRIERMKRMWEMHLGKMDDQSEVVCLLPGPVTISPRIKAAFHEPPIYHRGSEFIDRFANVRQKLSQMVGGRSVALLNGSGTLANEAMLAALAAEQRQVPGSPRRGVMLINGEFGERLARQATRVGLQPRRLQWDWGEPWDLEQIDAVLADEPLGSWILGVHQESSTGILNDIAGLFTMARKRGVRVCLDCISSLGAVPIDLSQVYLATGTSGKSIGSYAGASIVFADEEAVDGLDQTGVPTYVDLAAALKSRGPCFTFPSSTLLALEAALESYATPEKAEAIYGRYRETGSWIRRKLRSLGLMPMAPEASASPVITTFTSPGRLSSIKFVARCRAWGFSIGGESTYLSDRRLVQIATMGAVEQQDIARWFEHLEDWLSKKKSLAAMTN